MADSVTTFAEIREQWRAFVAERDWQQFHSPKNLVMGLAVETAELMEHFLWHDGAASLELAKNPERKQAIADELADVASYVMCLSNVLDIDLSDAIRAKMVKNAVKYPAAKFRGRFE